jgi:betaine-aldehyde dehydrogenase
MKEFKLFIDGSLVKAGKELTFESVDPSTGEKFAKLADASIEDMQLAIGSARKAFDSGEWPGMTAEQRGIYLKKIADVIRKNAKELAELECADTGKTIKQTTFIDIPTVTDTFDYFSNVGDWLKDESNQVNAPVKSLTVKEPVGVVGIIIPWNYPLIMFGWKVAPALAAGNCIVFKPSKHASASICRLTELISEIGFPAGVINVVTTTDHTVGNLIVESPDVDMISFTGGTETGKELMRRAAGTMKKLSMELGGKSPNIVFADCDMDAALGGTMSAIFMNQGQMCTAGSRLILEEKIYDEFLNKLVEKTKKLNVSNAHEHSTDFGPLISEEHRQKVEGYIEAGKNEGARLLLGEDSGCEPRVRGCFILPAIFADVRNDMRIAQEEIFGPVLSVIKFSNEEEAVKIANDTQFGLASCIWTKDKEKASRVAKKLRCGTVWINTYGGFYNEAPFGGYKQSGFGRELGREGLLEYTQVKHMCIDETPGGRPLVSSWF